MNDKNKATLLGAACSVEKQDGTRPAGSSHLSIADIRKRLGDQAVLIALRSNSKKPLQEGWQTFTVAKMADPAHIASLSIGGNIGVVLGKNSNGLCTIDIDQDDEVAPFLALNPKLARALRTKRIRGGNIWVRVKGANPSSTKLRTLDGRDFGEWRGDGNQTVIHGQAQDEGKGEPKPTRYHIVHDGPVVDIEFQEINWPASLILPWLEDELERQFNPPLIPDEAGKQSLNQCYFVGRFAAEHRILHERDEREFYEYENDNGLWTRRTEDAVKQMFAADFQRLATQWKLPAIVRYRTNGLLRDLVTLLRGRVEKAAVFGNSERIIHVANGMLDLNCDPPVLRPFSPDYYSRNASPITFDEKAECPRFKEELLATALDDDDADLLQRWAGLCLLGRNCTQRLMLMTGTAGGGKSTLFSIIEEIIGVRNVAELRTNHLHKPFESFAYVGKTLLTGKDVPSDFLSSKGASEIKKLCGGDLLDAEGKGLNARVSMRGIFNIGITSNSRLRVRLECDAGAWARRILIIRFEKPKPVKPVRNFETLLLREEGPGILNWTIEGAVRHLIELDDLGDFRLTERQRARIDALLCESDSVRFFVQQMLKRDEGSNVTTEELIQAYVEFCDAHGWSALPRRTVENQLPDLMLEVFRAAKRNDIQRFGTSQKGYAAIAIKHRGESC